MNERVEEEDVCLSASNGHFSHSHGFVPFFRFQLFLRGLPHLTLYFEEPRDARRRQPDPQNEPNLYAITAQYPLPTTAHHQNQHDDEDDHHRVMSSAVVVSEREDNEEED